MPLRRPLHRSALLALVGCIALAGCGSVTPTATLAPVPTEPAPTATEAPRPPAEVFAEIRSAVETIRGLKPTSAVDPVTIDEAQLRTNLEAEFDTTWTAAQLNDAEDLLTTIGLLPKGSSLRALTLDFQSGQVAGYYSPDKDELYVVRRSGGLGPVDESTYAHEFTHQLQDQSIDLDALGIDVQYQSDRSLARLALVEGDAVSVQTTWMIENLDARELGELFAASLDPAAMAALERAPRYLRETALFPYQDGLTLVSGLLAEGGYTAVDAAFADPPDSTEQVLHPEKYVQREPPIEVSIPRIISDGVGKGWHEAGQDTLGELILRIWLTEGGVASATARAATAGWGGDRIALLRGPGGAVSVALRTEWDTPADADEFAAAAATSTTLPSTGRVSHEAGSTSVWIVIGEGATIVLRAWTQSEG
jgi:hypothetical protein